MDKNTGPMVRPAAPFEPEELATDMLETLSAIHACESALLLGVDSYASRTGPVQVAERLRGERTVLIGIIEQVLLLAGFDGTVVKHASIELQGHL